MDNMNIIFIYEKTTLRVMAWNLDRQDDIIKIYAIVIYRYSYNGSHSWCDNYNNS